MSCFESSTFLRNPQAMNQEILQKVCAALGWTFETKKEHNQTVLYVYHAKQSANLHGEFALKVVGNTITYNSFYMRNGRELIETLRTQFYQFNIAYAKETILRAFESEGFIFLSDNTFVPSAEDAMRFKMFAYSQINDETDKYTEIAFTIKFDGTIVSDSNYIPKDVHDKADRAMEHIDRIFGTERQEGIHIKRKEIPERYAHKAYCKAKTQDAILAY